MWLRRATWSKRHLQIGFVVRGERSIYDERGLSGEYPTILNISRTSSVVLMYLGSHSYYASVNSHSPVGLVSLLWDAVELACVFVIVAFTNLPPFKGDCSFGKRQESQGPKSGLYNGWQTWVMWCFAKIKSLHERFRMGNRIAVLKLICLFSQCDCDCHTLHKLSQRRLTAIWLVPRESDC